MFINLLTHTPLYVYWIFFSLLIVGITQVKTRQIGFKRAIVIPVILILLSIYAIFHDFGINFFGLLFWFCGIVFVLLINIIIKNQKEIKYSKTSKVFTVEGSFIPLLMMMLLFFTKYTVGVVTAQNLELLHTSVFIGTISFFYGIFLGTYILRLYIFANKLY